MVEVGGARAVPSLLGKGWGFNEIISIQHFNLPEVLCCSSCLGTVRYREIMFPTRDGRLQDC